jgi:hypothetical protein
MKAMELRRKCSNLQPSKWVCPVPRIGNATRHTRLPVFSLAPYGAK